MDKEEFFRQQFSACEMSVAEVPDMPEDTFDMLHKYGTYNIQPTADTENEFPEIAQGIVPQKTHREVNPKRHKK